MGIQAYNSLGARKNEHAEATFLSPLKLSLQTILFPCRDARSALTTVSGSSPSPRICLAKPDFCKLVYAQRLLWN